MGANNVGRVPSKLLYIAENRTILGRPVQFAGMRPFN